MQYFELRFMHKGDTAAIELLVALLTDAGCDSFMEEGNELLGYISAESIDDNSFYGIVSSHKLHGVKYLGHAAMPDTNWNALWESAYEPVLIDNRCFVRAPFHPAAEGIQYDIVIMPRMSFGTAHHETTALMISLLLEQELVGKAVLDMGCGTAVLAILARLMGASPVLAIDNDEWAYSNACDNVVLNNTDDIKVELGDVSLLSNRKFNLLIANINRNILLADMQQYARALEADGLLMLSGFFLNDLGMIKQEASQCGFEFVISKTKNDWAAAIFNLISTN